MPSVRGDGATADDWQVALLRGVNVGGGKRVPMAALKEVATEIGFRTPVTLLNSGNLVYRAGTVAPSQAEQQLRTALARAVQVDTPVFVRTRAQLATILAENPLPAEAALDPSRLLVTLWDDTVTAAQRARFATAPVVRERFVVGTHAIYLWFPDGMSASVIYEPTARPLGGHITARNWRTMEKLLGLMTTPTPP